jgi:hypothetical protein
MGARRAPFGARRRGEGCIYCVQRPDQLILQALVGLARVEDETGRPPDSRRLAARPSTLSTMQILLRTDLHDSAAMHLPAAIRR